MVADLSGSDLGGGTFIRASFNGATLVNIEAEGADFSNSEFMGGNLSESRIEKSSFERSTMSAVKFNDSHIYRCNFTNTMLSEAEFEESDLLHSNLSESRLAGANLTDSSLRATDLQLSNLEEAIAIRTDFRGADLTDSRLYDIHISDVQISQSTEFGGKSIYEKADFEDRNNDFGGEDFDRYRVASWVYRRLQTLFEMNAMTEKSREYYILRQEAQRKSHRDNRNFGDWFYLQLSKWVTKHNTSPNRVVASSLVVIGLFSLLYTLSGGVISTAATNDLVKIKLPNVFIGIGNNIYFSVVTFTTLGYGDLQPVGVVARFFAMVESLLGALLMAWLVFVLGRRTT